MHNRVRRADNLSVQQRLEMAQAERLIPEDDEVSEQDEEESKAQWWGLRETEERVFVYVTPFLFLPTDVSSLFFVDV